MRFLATLGMTAVFAGTTAFSNDLASGGNVRRACPVPRYGDKGGPQNQMTIFQKDTLDALFAELETSYAQTTEYDQLLRDAHLAIALSDAGKEYNGQVDQRVSTLIEKHRDGN